MRYSLMPPSGSCCLTECEGACGRLPTCYIVEFSELPWGLPTTWVILAYSHDVYGGTWFPNATYPAPTDTETADPDGTMDGLCAGWGVSELGTGELCHIRYWRRVMTGADNDVQCGILKYTRVMNVIAQVRVMLGADTTDENCPQNLRARVYIGICLVGDETSCEYDPNTSAGDASWEQLADLELGSSWSCGNLPTPMSDHCEDELAYGWEELPEYCSPFEDLDDPYFYTNWTTTYDFRVYGMWLTDIPNCTEFDVDNVALLDSDSRYAADWCDDSPEFTHELASGTTVRIYTSETEP